MIKIEHILFWILILAAIGIALWMLFGSPTLEAGLISIGLFIIGSEILLWKAFFSIDKRTAIGFEKVKLGFERVNDRLKNIDGRLIDIEKDVGGIKQNIGDMTIKITGIESSITKINKKLKVK